MGLYRRRNSKSYWMTFTVNGRRVHESTGTPNRKLAEKINAKKTLEIAEGKFFDRRASASITMEELLDKYMAEISPGLSPSTHGRNAQIVKNLKAFFGSYLLKDVRPPVVSDYKAWKLQQDYARETVLRELGLLRRVFSIAVDEWELCRENPVRKVLRSMGKADNKRVRYLSPDESQRLMLALPLWLRPMIAIARHTGLRRGNIVDLTWKQVHLQSRVITIERTKNGEPIGIPLTETAVKTLSECQRVRHLHSPYVFCDADGGRYSRYQVSVAFKRACVRAGIENLRFHDLRHDFASNLVQAGVDIYRVKDLLGHKDLRMTQRYCHLAPENLREAIDLLDDRLNRYSFATIRGKTKGVTFVTP